MVMARQSTRAAQEKDGMRNFFELIEVVREPDASNIFSQFASFILPNWHSIDYNRGQFPVGKGITMAGVMTPNPTPAYEYTILKS